MKKEKETIICVAMATWEGDYAKAVVHLMSALGTFGNVLFVNYQFTWSDVFKKLLGIGEAPVSRMLGFESRIETSEENQSVFILTPPPVLPINWIKSKRLHGWLNQLNGVIVSRAIKRACRKLGLSTDLMINAYNPTLGVPLLGKLDVRKTYYYCYDEISQSKWCKKHGPRYESLFVAEVDAVFASSKALVKKLADENEKVTWIPSGVDFELFNQAFEKPTMAKTEQRVCFIGSLDFRVDFDLLYFLVNALPKVQFDLVGRIVEARQVKRFETLPNVKIHGPHKPKDLPGFLSDASVGIIPFVKNEFTRNIYPLKINEYLAAGLPVVASDFADLLEFSHVISCASSDQEFLHALTNALKETDPGARLTRNQLAFQNSWQSRAQMLYNYHLYADTAS